MTALDSSPLDPAVAAAPGDPARTRTSLTLVVVALVCAIWGDVSLRTFPWGLDLTVWLALVALALLGVAHGRGLTAVRRGPIAASLCFAALIAWRTSGTLISLDVLGVLVLAAAALVDRQQALVRARTSDVVKAALSLVCGAAFFAPVLAVIDIVWRDLPRAGVTRYAIAVSRGLLLAVPLLLVFGGLLMSADAVFGHLLRTVFNISPEEVFGHVLGIGLLAWGVGGYVRVWSFGLHVPGMSGATVAPTERSTGFVLGAIETTVVLGLLDVLFLAFVAVQFRYFFGGAALIAATPNLTYASYAREGFFELVTVVTLALPVLLGVQAMFPTPTPQKRWLFRGLAGLMVALLAVILTSALMRMLSYSSAYGLTELRIYTTAFMAWLAIALFWFVPTMLGNYAERFVFGAIASGLLVIVGLNIAGPDALIARANMAPNRHPKLDDVLYILRLGSGVVPGVVENLASLNPDTRAQTAYILEDAYGSKFKPRPWGSWSWELSQADRAVADRQPELALLAAQNGPFTNEDFYFNGREMF